MIFSKDLTVQIESSHASLWMTQWVEGVFYNGFSTIVYKYIFRNIKNNQTCILFSLHKVFPSFRRRYDCGIGTYDFLSKDLIGVYFESSHAAFWMTQWVEGVF
jgi:hypothetical protein